MESKQRSWLARWFRRGLWIGAIGVALLGGAFWVWPLHFQAYWPTLGEFFTERPRPEEWSQAQAGNTDSLKRVDEPVPEPKGEVFFPPQIFGADEGGAYQERWRASDLFRLGETSLFEHRLAPSAHSYRFTWLRSFDPPISVRLDVAPDGSGQLIARHRMLHPSRELPPTSSSRQLSKRAVARFIRQIEHSGFWSDPVSMGQSGLDGSTWIFEACRDGNYHVVDYSNPGNGDPLKSLGLNLLEAAGFWRGPVY